MGDRRRSRELALQTLFSLEFDERSPEACIGEMRARAEEPESVDEELAELVRGGPSVQAFAAELIEGVTGHLDEIDALLGRFSTNWKVSRMALVDRNILRVACFELLHLKGVPPKVTLNEAVEIAKRYGSTDSSAFINGILDRIASEVAPR
jgi:transcription antitermination protein NusB